MVKLRQDSGGSEDQTSHGPSCSPDALKMNGSPWQPIYVSGSCNGKASVKETRMPAVNGHCDKVLAKKVSALDGSSSNAVPVNGIKTVNGHCNNIPAEKAPTVNGNSYNRVLLNDVPTVNGKHVDEVTAVVAPISNEESSDKNDGDCLNGSNIPSENGIGSNGHSSNSIGNEDNSGENQHGFIEVVNKKKRNKNKIKNHRQKPSTYLPPGLTAESIRRDNTKDKNSDEKISSPAHIPQKPPSRNFAAVRSSGKSYSSVLVNGHNPKPQTRNDGPNTNTSPQNVTKCNKSDTSFKSCTSPGTQTSFEQLSTELESVVIKDTSASCKEDNSLTKVEMTDVSAQTDVSSQVDTAASQKESINLQDKVVENSEKANSQSDYVDVGEISDESSNAAYCDSVVSNDSGRGDSEITYDESMPYCCEFPREKTSQLIGRGGSFKYEIERKSGIKLWVYNHEFDKDLSIVCMIGTGAQIEKAKKLIKERFRHATLRQWLGVNPINPPLSEKYLPILPEGTDFMGVVSCICDPNFFWLQQYGHPHLYSLEDLERRMSEHFNTVPDAPGIDNPTIGSVIAVPGSRDGDNVKWIRGWVINLIPEDENLVVRYLDHGGDHLVPISNIRPMRHDFFSMPFFAAQCCLYDILPTGGVWSDEARAEFTRLCNGSSCPPIVRVIYKTPECYFVTMFGYDPEIHAQVDIASHLITKGFGVRPCLPATEFATDLQ